jgi:hypothetical protein
MQRRILLLGVVVASFFTLGVAIAAVVSGYAADADPGSDITLVPHLVTLGLGLAAIIAGTIILHGVASRRSRRQPK